VIGGLDHVQVAAPPGCEQEARSFYGGTLGFEEIEKPPLLAARDGVWFRAGAHELHVGVEPEFAPARKAHPAFAVADLDALAARIGEVTWADPAKIPRTSRSHCHDPFGNRLEFVQA
jgi:catechol 2,3-dioxygenase-like lactoylglutathione lyase family enzyme